MIGSEISTWQRRTDRIPLDAGSINHADRLLAEADAAEMRAMRSRQAANRTLSYNRNLPTKYANTTYGTLRPEQNPRGLISSWWERGPRALVVAGPQRTGKTTAAYAIANTVHTSGAWVYALTAGSLSRALKPGGDPVAYSYATRCDLLLLDDLGREKATDWWLEQLQEIVDDRCANERRIIVTTNSDPDPQSAYDAIAARYGDPIAERLIDDGGIVILDGPAIRRVTTAW